jgi:hypothetical protein
LRRQVNGPAQGEERGVRGVSACFCGRYARFGQVKRTILAERMAPPRTNLNPTNLCIESAESPSPRGDRRFDAEARTDVETARDATFATYQNGLIFSGLQWFAPVRFNASVSGAAELIWQSNEFAGACSWSSGIFSFKGQLPNSPFSFEFILKGAADEEVSSIRFQFDIDAWKSQRISRLAYFDEVFALAEAVFAGGRLNLECWSEAGRIVSVRPHEGSAAFFAKMRPALLPLAAARDVTRATHVDPVFDGPLGEDDVSQIDLLHALSRGVAHREAASGMRLTMRLGAEGLRALLADPTGNASGSVRLHQEQHSFLFLGDHVVAQNVDFELTHAQLDSNPEELRGLVDRSAGEAEVTYVGRKEAELIVTAESLAKSQARGSILDLLSAGPGGRLFKTSQDVDEYLRRERDAWED